MAWTDDETDSLLRRHAEGQSVNEIAAGLRKSPDAIRNKIKRTGVTELPPTHAVSKQDVAAFAQSAGVSVKSEWQDEEDYGDLWGRWEQRNSKSIERAHKQHRFTADVPGNKPIGICFASDQHIAQGPIDLKRMREDAELIRDTQGLYAVLGGDGVDNHIKIRAAMLTDSGSPGDQWMLYNHYLRIFGDKIIALISGNHDDWTKQACGIDAVRMLAQNNKLCYAPSEALIDVRLGSQCYKVAIRHRFRMNSTFNQGHAPKQWLRMSGMDSDIAVVCHHHEASVESWEWGGKTRWVARPGSYQITSSYTKDFGWDDAKPTCPTVVLWPNQHRIVAFRDVRDAVWAMGSSR